MPFLLSLSKTGLPKNVLGGKAKHQNWVIHTLSFHLGITFQVEGFSIASVGTGKKDFSQHAIAKLLLFCQWHRISTAQGSLLTLGKPYQIAPSANMDIIVLFSSTFLFCFALRCYLISYIYETLHFVSISN